MSDDAPRREPDREPALPLLKSLRGKALLGTLALLAYLLGSVLYISGERGKIYAAMQLLEQLNQHEKAVALAEAAVSGAVLDVNVISSAAQPEPALPAEIALYMESCAKLFAALDTFDASYALLQRPIARSYATLQGAPLRANWIDLREALSRAADELDIRRRRLADRREALTQGYQRQYDAVTVESLVLALVGIVIFGSLAAWFFTRMAGDIRLLDAHARQIVRGARGVAMPVRRDDELGQLMRSVNRMSADLDEREKQIEVDGQRRSHQDKMLAVGALAAGIAHEVNNPLAVITGAAQELRAAPGMVTAQVLDDSAQLILAQAERAARAARQLAEVAAPATDEADWIDVNAMVRRVVQLTGYDRRFRQFTFDTALDPGLPAIRFPANALQQVLMQMMSIACDALVAALVAPATVRLDTAATPQLITVQLQFAPVLDFSLPEVQRALLLCRAVIEPHRGRLAFGQTEESMMRFKLSLPVDPGEEG